MVETSSEVRKPVSTRFRILVEFEGFVIATGWEMIRSTLISGNYFPILENEAQKPQALIKPLNPESPAFQFLQNAGDFWDGYLYSFIGYNLLNAADKLQSLITRRRLPEWVKLGFTSAFVFAGVVGMETGKLPLRGTADEGDILGGAIGIGAYGLTHFLATKWRPLPKQIEKI